jgi:hypothetical protein
MGAGCLKSAQREAQTPSPCAAGAPIHWALVGRPLFLVRDGTVQEKVMHRERITRHELMSTLR